MLNNETKRRIDAARDILVGKVPDPKSQIEQITLALIYKFMDDMDREAVEKFKGKAKFFTGEWEKYSWRNIFDPGIGGHELIKLYGEALEKMNTNPGIPGLFKDIFKNAYLPYRNPETLKLFLKTINEFSYAHSEELGNAYEYLLSVLGTQGDAGQFRTPRHIIEFIVACLDPQKHETICDPACGTAGFLLSAYKHILRNNCKDNPGDKLTPDERKILADNLTGYDIDPNMERFALVNMFLHGFVTPRILEYDTLTSEDRWNDYFDVIMANPPFMTPKGGIRPHRRFSIQANKSEVLFTDYIAEHLNPNGRAGVIVPNGIIATTQTAYKSLRRMLVEGYLVAVVSLPAGVFNPYSGVKTSILLMDKKLSKKTDDILFLKVENDGYDLGAQRRDIDKNDLPEAIRLFAEFKQAVLNGSSFNLEENRIGQLVSKEKILENRDVNLGGDRYIIKVARDSKYPIIQLGSVIDIIMGQAPSSSDCNIEGIGTPFVKVGQFGEIRPIINEWTTNPLKLATTDDVLICVVGATIGKLNLGINCSIGRSVAVLRPKKNQLEQVYLYQLLKEWIKKLRSQAQGSAQGVITREMLFEIQIPLSPLSIQHEIVTEIEGYQKIIDGARQVVENYKPQIKIKPEWKMVELGEVFKLSSGKFLPAKNMIDGEYYVYGGNGINGKHNEYFIEHPTIVIGRVGEYCGAVHISKAKSWVSDNGLYVTNFLKEVNLNYLKIILEQVNLNQYAKVGGQPSISQSSIYEIKIPLPIKSIQDNIISFILEEERYVESTKNLIKIYEQKIKDRISEVWGE